MNEHKNKRDSHTLLGEASLLIAALIWGSAYIFQKAGMEYIGPLTFSAFRFLIGSAVLLPTSILISRVRQNRQELPSKGFRDRTLLTAGFLCGITHTLAGCLQQTGLVYTTAGKSAFLTAVDVLIVPFLLVFLGRKVKSSVWIAVVVACAGMYLLCINEQFSINIGDILTIGCAAVYAVQTLLIDHFAPKVEIVRMAFLEFFVAGVLSGAAALLFEDTNPVSLLSCAGPLLYVGILEIGLAFTLQILGQKYISPAIATIMFNLSSVFAAVLGVLVLGEVMGRREIIGCVLMLSAFMIAQLPGRKKSAEH